MLQSIFGVFNGTGAALILELGAIPEHIEFWGLEGATPDTVIWDKAMQYDALTCEGIMRPTAGGAVADYALGEGVRPYFGGETLDSTLQTSTTYGSGVYMSRDDHDYRRYGTDAAGGAGDAATTDITDWTLDTSGSNAGHFNGDVTGTYIGNGSRIIIESTAFPKVKYDVGITSVSAGAGGASGEVVLSYPVPSGKVQFIGGMYQYAASAIGHITQAGMKMNLTSTPNVSGELIAFRALINC